jgi:AcrR family transcriptional regulator
MASQTTVSRSKGERTRAAILDQALRLVSKAGLDGLTIGTLAEATGMSKSGLFAHFGSREELLLAVLAHGQAQFGEVVFEPALAKPRGLPRLRAMFANWMQRTSVEIDSGCIYISGAVEFDDRPGPVRDALAHSVQTWHAAMKRAITLAKECGHLEAAVDEEQMLFEIHGLILALHYEARFLKNPGSIARANAGFENILRRYGAPAPADRAAKSTRSPKNAKE